MTSKTIKQQETKLHIDILYEKNCLPERGWGRKNCLHNHGAWNTHPLSEKKNFGGARGSDCPGGASVRWHGFTKAFCRPLRPEATLRGDPEETSGSSLEGLAGPQSCKAEKQKLS